MRAIFAVLKKITDGINFKHSEGNADSHAKATLVGNHVVIPFENGNLLLGTWQRIVCDLR